MSAAPLNARCVAACHHVLACARASPTHGRMRRILRAGLTYGRCSALRRGFHEDAAAVLKGDVPFDKDAAKLNQQAMDATVAQVGWGGACYRRRWR